jgi:tRNA pseudouridine38-40 synthase
MRLRIDLGYDGTHFHGWAKQPGLRTVQGVMEDSLSRILRLTGEDSQIRLTVAGRTDTGVHARHQVCHVDIEPEVISRAVGHLTDVEPPQALLHRLRHVVPDDIALLALKPAPLGFDARFSALERTYIYRICDDWRYRDPRTRHFVLPVKTALDEDSLAAAAQMVVGLQDFGSFATPNPGGTTIREVKVARWRRVPVVAERAHSGGHGDGHGDASHGVEDSYGALAVGAGTLEFTIVADAFAHNMVRSLVGAQVQVGLGKKSLDWFAEKLAHPVREGSAGPIGAQGLTLEHVAYPDDSELASRAQLIRAKRTLPAG